MLAITAMLLLLVAVFVDLKRRVDHRSSVRVSHVSGVLGLGDPKKTKEGAKSRFWQRKFVLVSLTTVLASAGLSFGLMRLDTDPNLLDYSKKGQQPRDGLEYVDRNGGVNPLTIVIAARDGGKLDSKEEYEKM